MNFLINWRMKSEIQTKQQGMDLLIVKKDNEWGFWSNPKWSYKEETQFKRNEERKKHNKIGWKLSYSDKRRFPVSFIFLNSEW